MDDAPRGYHAQLDELIAQARIAHAELLERVPDGLRASLPVDGTGVTQAIDILAGAVGITAELHAIRDRLNAANPAVLHGRVFGRAEQLSADTVVAAFADGARVRRTLLEELAAAIGGGLNAKRTADGSFRVRAWLPTEGQPPSPATPPAAR